MSGNGDGIEMVDLPGSQTGNEGGSGRHFLPQGNSARARSTSETALRANGQQQGGGAPRGASSSAAGAQKGMVRNPQGTAMTPEEIAQVQAMRRHLQQQEAIRRQQLQQAQGAAPAPRPPAERELTDEEEMQLELKYGADQVIALILPVSLCMLVVIATIQSVSYYATQDTQFAYSPYSETSSNGGGERFGGALLNAIIIIGIIIVMTMVLVVLYKYRCYRAIHGWLIMSSMLLLFFFSYQFITQVLEGNNATIDYITMSIAVWNFGWVGLAVIHWKGPLLLQQCYLIAVSALMALVLIKNLPAWTTWVLLGAIALYDLVAVLCPGGPLRQLVELAQEREEPLFPALVYSSTMVWLVGMADADPPPYKDPPGPSRGGGSAITIPPSSSSSFVPPPNAFVVGNASRSTPGNNTSPPRSSSSSSAGHGGAGLQSPTATSPHSSTSTAPVIPPEEEAERKGVKLGLGDFIFYSVLVGKAATVDWGTIIVCYIAILIGLAATLLLLSILKHALPALPISIALGLLFYFITSLLLTPFLDELSYKQVFI